MFPFSIRRFVTRHDGNVAVIFALASLPVLGFAGMAIDYGLATRLQAQLQAATDATSLMLCQSTSTTTVPQLQAQAATTMGGYMGSGVNLVVDPLAVTQGPRKIQLTTHATSKAYLGNFTGQKSLGIAATAQCATPVPKTFEIALVLDTTGSMANSGGSGTKLAAAQQAAANFVDYVKGNTAFASDTRISIVPFAASVAVDPRAYAAASWIDQAGASTYHWTNVDKTQAKAAGFASRFSIFNLMAAKYAAWAWAGCFETLPYPANVQDGSPTSNDTLYVPMFAPDEPGDGSGDRVTFTASSTGTRYYSYNSYLDDSTSVGACKTDPSTFALAENRACKYVGSQGATYTTSTDVGIPNGPNFGCTSKPLQRLTTSTSTLKTLINNLSASGATNTHEGFMWGWRTLSPTSVFADGASYSSKTTSKVIILMTDGANSWTDNPNSNYNQTLYFSMGYFLNANGTTPNDRLPSGYRNLTTATAARNALDQLTLEACQNAQSAGISIYTIGFSVNSDPIDTQGTNLLASCASSPSQAFIANDSTSLINAFSKIASSIGSIRLTQ